MFILHIPKLACQIFFCFFIFKWGLTYVCVAWRLTKRLSFVVVLMAILWDRAHMYEVQHLVCGKKVPSIFTLGGPDGSVNEVFRTYALGGILQPVSV